MYILNEEDFLSNMTQRSTCDNGPTPLLARSTTLVCGGFIVGIEVSNPAEGMDVHNLCLLCKKQPLQRADNPFIGVLRILDQFNSNK